MKYKILTRGPVKGKRTVMCKTDEALVNRISANSKYDGMVERLQPLKKSENGFIIFQFDFLKYGSRYPSGPTNINYHILKFLALKLAQIHFPENIVNMHELRFFRRKGMIYAATYSDFVPDETGVIKRRKEAMQRYYTIMDFTIVDKSDKIEECLNPDLRRILLDLYPLGIIPAHPQANYHIHNGNTVLFEIDLAKAAYYTNRIKDPEKREKAIELVAMMCGCILKEWASWEVNRSTELGNIVNEIGFRRMVNRFNYLFLLHKSQRRDMNFEFLMDYEALKNSVWYGITPYLNVELNFMELPVTNSITNIDPIYDKFGKFVN